MKLLYNFCFLFFSFVANCQKNLKGVILNAQTSKPVPHAAVFINTTSIGTTSDEQGNFILKIPDGRCALVVTSAGFETNSQIIATTDLPDLITVSLQTKTRSLQKTEKDGWANWGNFFLINFIGSSANVKNCKIKNTKAIHFYASEEKNELLASADEPLLIENKALGYTIKYYLESFLFNFETLLFSYRGYSFFQPMEGSPDKQKIWELNRSEAYFGSMMHFMRSLYRNQIEEEGFNVRSLKKVRNIPSYQSNKTDSTDLSIKMTDSTQTVVSNNMDDDYQDQILNEDNYRDVIGITLPGDSIAYAINTTTIGFDFNDFLLVTYRGKETPIEYQQQLFGTSMTSQLILINKRPVEIESNGSYYNVGDLMVLGYWTWAQKIANILPFDYNPPKAK